MLFTKSAIQKELASRLAEFAPPGEQMYGCFEAEVGQVPFINYIGDPLYVVLTNGYVLFIAASKGSNKPVKTLAAVPRQAIRFSPPNVGVAHFWVTAQTMSPQGQISELRLKVHKMWRTETQQLVMAAGA
jgi:hypothetical protein